MVKFTAKNAYLLTHIYSRKMWHPYRVDLAKQILIRWIIFSIFVPSKWRKTVSSSNFRVNLHGRNSSNCRKIYRVQIIMQFWAAYGKTRKSEVSGPSLPATNNEITWPRELGDWNWRNYSSSVFAIFGFTFSNQSSYSRYIWSSLLLTAPHSTGWIFQIHEITELWNKLSTELCLNLKSHKLKQNVIACLSYPSPRLENRKH